jgi:hypothetical protein
VILTTDKSFRSLSANESVPNTVFTTAKSGSGDSIDLIMSSETRKFYQRLIRKSHELSERDYKERRAVVLAINSSETFADLVGVFPNAIDLYEDFFGPVKSKRNTALTVMSQEERETVCGVLKSAGIASDESNCCKKAA